MTAAICIAVFAGCVAMSLRLAKFIKDCDERDVDNWKIDHDVCPGCEGFLEFDDEHQNICLSCGQSTYQGWRR